MGVVCVFVEESFIPGGFVLWTLLVSGSVCACVSAFCVWVTCSSYSQHCPYCPHAPAAWLGQDTCCWQRSLGKHRTSCQDMSQVQEFWS